MSELLSDHPFRIRGASVSVASLLNTQLLAADTGRIKNDRTRSRKAGDQRSYFRGQGREFIEMKHYQNGDDVRRIDWKITARKQQPFVRIMEEDRHAEQAIWLTLTPSCYFGTSRCLKSVMLVHWTAFLIWRFLHLKHPVRLMIQLNGQQQELKIVNKQQAAQACHALAANHQKLADTFQADSPENTFNWPSHWLGKPNLWLLSDFQQFDLKKLQKAIPRTKITRVNIMQAIDIFDQQLPNSGQLPVKYQSKKTVINTEQESARIAHENMFIVRQQALSTLANYFGGQLISNSNQAFAWQDVTQWPL